LHFKLRHNRSMNTLAIQRPPRSIEMRTEASVGSAVDRGEMNWLSWSVLTVSHVPNRANASSTAARKISTSSVLDKQCHATGGTS
jgi:hypothetical protein